MSAQVSERQLKSVIVELGSMTADTTVPALYVGRKIKLKKVVLLNGAAIAADNTDWVSLLLKNGSTTLADLDTRAAGEGAVAQNVAKDIPLVSGAEEVAAGSTLTLVYDESGTMALTNAKVQIDYYEIGNN